MALPDEWTEVAYVAISDEDGLVRSNSGLDITHLWEHRANGKINRDCLPSGATIGKDRNDWIKEDVDVLIPAAVQDAIRGGRMGVRTTHVPE